MNMPDASELNERIEFLFASSHTPSAPLTTGQKYMWECLGRLGDTVADQNCSFLVKNRNPDLSIEELAHVLRDLVLRNESLRTVYKSDAHQQPFQLLLSEGDIPIVYDTREVSDSLENATALVVRLTQRPFAMNEMPLRIGCSISKGKIAFIALVFSHMAVDAGALVVIKHQLESALARTVRRPEPTLPRQPIEQEAWERAPNGAKVLDRSHGYWRQALEKFPHRMFETRYAPERNPQWHELRLRSRRMRDGVVIAAAAFKMNETVVMMAALALALSRLAQRPYLATTLYTSNRFHVGLTNYVGNLAQVVPFFIDVTTPDINHLLSAIHRELLTACRFGIADPIQVEKISQAAREGEGVVLDSRVNLIYDARINLFRMELDDGVSQAETRYANDNYNSQDFSLSWTGTRAIGLNSLAIRSYDPSEIFFLFSDEFISKHEMELLAGEIDAIIFGLVQARKSPFLSLATV